MKRTLPLWLSAACLAVLGGAGSALAQAYDGLPPSPNQPTKLIVDSHFGWATNLELIQIDDANVENLTSGLTALFKGSDYSLPPGEHQLAFDTQTHVILKLALMTLPGHQYRITRSGSFDLIVQDETNGTKWNYKHGKLIATTRFDIQRFLAEPVTPPPLSRAASGPVDAETPPPLLPPAPTYDAWLKQNAASGQP